MLDELTTDELQALEAETRERLQTWAALPAWDRERMKRLITATRSLYQEIAARLAERPDATPPDPGV